LERSIRVGISEKKRKKGKEEDTTRIIEKMRVFVAPETITSVKTTHMHVW